MDAELKDLLTLAAKACGYSLVWGEKFNVGSDLVDCTDMPFIKSDAHDELDVYWAPHLDDGDGARMEGKLKLSPVWEENGVCSTPVASIPGWFGTYEKYAKHNGDEQAARRWASLRAAASIGKGI